mmetsp:Transcript_73749/g.130245  ORF Transcript_73749/g.130245 Transcript_73749/m.130245 type:complete len:246 (+) Transcript_73749:424-1161(+)
MGFCLSPWKKIQIAFSQTSAARTASRGYRALSCSKRSVSKCTSTTIEWEVCSAVTPKHKSSGAHTYEGLRVAKRAPGTAGTTPEPSGKSSPASRGGRPGAFSSSSSSLGTSWRFGLLCPAMICVPPSSLCGCVHGNACRLNMPCVFPCQGNFQELSSLLYKLMMRQPSSTAHQDLKTKICARKLPVSAFSGSPASVTCKLVEDISTFTSSSVQGLRSGSWPSILWMSMTCPCDCCQSTDVSSLAP